MPEDKLSIAVAAVRNGLEHAASVLAEIEGLWWRTATLHPEKKPGETYRNDADAYFTWFAGLYDRLCKEQPEVARRELLAWPEHEPFFFDKLRIWAWMKAEVTTASEAAKGFLSLSLSEFWPAHHERELLWTLRARWKAFSRNAAQ